MEKFIERLRFANRSTSKRLFIIIICLFAMLRVFLFSAGFPFFSPVDEIDHFDTIVNYENGHIPHRGESLFVTPWTARMLALYGSPQYMGPLEHPPLGAVKDNPFYIPFIDQYTQNYAAIIANKEIHSPPTYYVLAAIWFKIGMLLECTGGMLLYWLRFMNVIVYGIVVWLAYFLIDKNFPEDTLLCFGVPMLLATFPQDVFFQINNDILSPLVCTLSLYLMLQIYFNNKTVIYHAVTGLVISATMLTKLTNIPIVALFIIVMAMLLYRHITSKELWHYRWHLVVLIVSVLTPLACWMGWNLYAVGDVMGTGAKLQILGWTRKPFPGWFDHPIFTPSRFLNWLSELTSTFWRGEMVAWEGKRTATEAADWFYVVSSAIFITCGTVHLFSNFRNMPASQTIPRFFCLFLLTAFIGVLFLLSIQFDFGNGLFPSRDNPFFLAGRLIIGALIPFLVLYVDGVRYCLSKLRLPINPLIIVGIICAIVTVFQVNAHSMVFKSPYNLFHLMLAE